MEVTLHLKRKPKDFFQYRRRDGKKISILNYSREGSSSPSEHALKMLNDKLTIMERELQVAREQSFKAGFEEGMERAQREAQKQAEKFEIEKRSIQQEFQQVIHDLETPVLELATAMARRVIAMELEHRDDYIEIVKNQLRRQLDEVIDQNNVVIQVNPEVLKNIDRERLSHDLKPSQNMQVNIVGNQDIRPGESKIRSEKYYVDGSFDNQLDQLKDELKNKELQWKD